MGDPISEKFCTTTGLRDIMIYSGPFLNNFNRYVFAGVEFSIID